MRIITKKRLEDFMKDYPDAMASLKFWYDTIKISDFYLAQEVINLFKGADYVGNDRIIFNIARNKYRLIVKFEFKMWKSKTKHFTLFLTRTITKINTYS